MNQDERINKQRDIICGEKQKCDSPENKPFSVIASLAETYAQLYLDPDQDEIGTYKRTVLQGEIPELRSLSCYHGSSEDKDEWIETPAGPVRVVTLMDRHDFEIAVRNMMAAKDGPKAEIPRTMGASTLTAFNWGRIRNHQMEFIKRETEKGVAEPDWDAEFKRFISVKANYIDHLIILSRGPYSNVAAEAAGHAEEEWLEISDTIRKYHELTHVICRRLYPARTDAVLDELIADAVGLYAAYGHPEPEKEKLFLGISQNTYIGGRLENYTDKPENLVVAVCEKLDLLTKAIEDNKGISPLDMPEILMNICAEG